MPAMRRRASAQRSQAGGSSFMRRLLFSGLTVLLLVWPTGAALHAAWVDPQAAPDASTSAPSASSTTEDPGAVLERGLDKERSRNWGAAMEVYREALEHWPSRVEFGRRLRLC